MTNLNTNQSSVIGDIVFLQDNGLGIPTLPAVDASQIIGVTTTIPTGNTLWVDAVNGNDSTGINGRLDKPYLTISAAITAATSGDVIHVRPGTYTEATITLKTGVSILGLDQVNCILQPALTNGVTYLTAAASLVFVNFTILLAAGSGVTATGIGLSGTVNESVLFKNVAVVDSSTSTGHLLIINDTSSGIANPAAPPTFEDCTFTHVSTTNTAACYTAGTNPGTTVFRDCTFDGGTSGLAFSISNGRTAYFFGCRNDGTTGSNLNGTSILYVDRETSFEFPPSVASTATLSIDGIYYPRDNTASSDPTSLNDITQAYGVGSKWINTITNRIWTCTNTTVGAAVWVGSPMTAQATVDFANITGLVEGDTASVTIAATWVTASTIFNCTVMGGTSQHDLEDPMVEGIVAYVTTVTPGTSFVVEAYAPSGSWGQYLINVQAQ